MTQCTIKFGIGMVAIRYRYPPMDVKYKGGKENMKKNFVLFNKTLVFGSIAISFLIVLASLPSVFASQANKYLDINRH